MSLAQISTPPQATAEVVVNRNFETMEHAAVYGQRQSAHSGLTWGYYGGRWGGFSVSDGTLTLSNATNYVVVQRSDGAISTSTTKSSEIVLMVGEASSKRAWTVRDRQAFTGTR